MSAMPKAAMVLAAGLGTRMKGLIADKPKALVEVLGKPLIDYAIEKFALAGIKKLVVNVHHQANALEAHLKKRRGVEIVISDERAKLLETGGGIKKALPLLGPSPFFAHNSDSLWVEGYASTLERMAARFDEREMDALLLLAPFNRAVGYEGAGDFDMAADGTLKRRAEQRVAAFAFTGLQLLQPRAFAGAPEGAFSMNAVWDRAAEAGKLYGIRLDGTWLHVGTPEGLREAEAALRELQRGE